MIMSYRYCVVWHTKAKSWMGKVRPMYPECRMFMSLEKARKFASEFIPPAKIYAFKENGRHSVSV